MKQEPVVADPSAAPQTSRRLRPWELFCAFAHLGLIGFGGVLPWARYVLVERRGWLDDREFAELVSLGQVLPGPNICNTAVMLGQRRGGPLGATAAITGIVAPPFVIVIVLAELYRRYGELPVVQGAVRGMCLVASGLIIATALKLAHSEPRTARGLLFGVASFVGSALLGLPLLPMMGLLIPLAIVAEWRRRA